LWVLFSVIGLKSAMHSPLKSVFSSVTNTVVGNDADITSRAFVMFSIDQLLFIRAEALQQTAKRQLLDFDLFCRAASGQMQFG
jgi:hypothetical protein